MLADQRDVFGQVAAVRRCDRTFARGFAAGWQAAFSSEHLGRFGGHRIPDAQLNCRPMVVEMASVREELLGAVTLHPVPVRAVEFEFG